MDDSKPRSLLGVKAWECVGTLIFIVAKILIILSKMNLFLRKKLEKKNVFVHVKHVFKKKKNSPF
jgi:hypothetical protein